MQPNLTCHRPDANFFTRGGNSRVLNCLVLALAVLECYHVLWNAAKIHTNSMVEISERAQRLLKKLVEAYIRDGQPVGSRALARESGLDLSPATVRNIMIDLEELGMVMSPHTSAGRVPTAKGYRLFVDALLKVQPLHDKEVIRLKNQLDINGKMEDLLGSASALLSDITRMAGVVMVPRREITVLRQIEFLPLSDDNRVLVIVVVNEREVQNRIITTARRYSPAELQQAANYLTAMFAGKDLRAIRNAVVSEMKAARDEINHVMQSAITMAGQVFSGASGDLHGETSYLLAGQTNLMDFTELSDLGKLRQLFDAFAKKGDILHLLDQCLRAESVQAFIGAESGHKALEECSVVTAPYMLGGKLVGVLGVIGPTRMAYDRVIPVVDITAKLLSAALSQRP